MSSDNGVSKPGVKTIPRRPGTQGCARAGQGWGHTKGWWLNTLAWRSWQLLVDSSCSCWPRDWSWAMWPGTPLQASWCPRTPGGLGVWHAVLAEDGRMVWRKSQKIQHKHPGDCGGGERGSLERHLSLVHRGERHNLQGGEVVGHLGQGPGCMQRPQATSGQGVL